MQSADEEQAGLNRPRREIPNTVNILQLRQKIRFYLGFLLLMLYITIMESQNLLMLFDLEKIRSMIGNFTQKKNK